MTKVIITAELEIDDDYLNESPLADDLVGEFVKVKSGAYENVACGWITNVVVPSLRQDGGKSAESR